MELDFNYLFSPGNIVIIRNNKMNKIYTHTVLTKEEKEGYINNGDSYFEDKDYQNPKMKYDKFQILTIYEVDSEGNIKSKIFDYHNLTPPFPKLETGMFVQNKYGKVGVVIGEYIYYNETGWDFVKDIQEENNKDNYIIAIYNAQYDGFAAIKRSVATWVFDTLPCRYYEHGRCTGQRNTPECFCQGRKEACPKYSWEELTK